MEMWITETYQDSRQGLSEDCFVPLSVSSVEMSPSTIFIIMKLRGFRYIWSLVVLDTIKIFNFSCKSILVAEMLSRSTSVEGTAGEELFQPYLPSERSCITKTHGYSNCHLYCEIKTSTAKISPKAHMSECKSSVSKVWKHENWLEQEVFPFLPLISCPYTDQTDGKWEGKGCYYPS